MQAQGTPWVRNDLQESINPFKGFANFASTFSVMESLGKSSPGRRPGLKFDNTFGV
jgi:hypothetical protein